MRTCVSLALALVLTLAAAATPGLSAAEQRAGQPAGALKGTAYTTDLRPVANVKVQIRNTNTGQLAGWTISDPTGQFAFTAVQPGGYILEALDAQGRVVGMTAPFGLGAGANLTVSVVAVAGGAVAPAGNSGLSILGLGPVTSLAVLGAAGAAAVTAVVSTRTDASPSR